MQQWPPFLYHDPPGTSSLAKLLLWDYFQKIERSWSTKQPSNNFHLRYPPVLGGRGLRMSDSLGAHNEVLAECSGG